MASGFFAIAADDRFIGRAGLHHVEIDGAARNRDRICGDAGILAPRIRDRDGARDSRYRGQTRIRDLVAFTLPTNLGSRGVMEKVGFRYERDITWANLPHVLYRSDMPLTGGEHRGELAVGIEQVARQFARPAAVQMIVAVDFGDARDAPHQYRGNRGRRGRSA